MAKKTKYQLFVQNLKKKANEKYAYNKVGKSWLWAELEKFKE